MTDSDAVLVERQTLLLVANVAITLTVAAFAVAGFLHVDPSVSEACVAASSCGSGSSPSYWVDAAAALGIVGLALFAAVYAPGRM